MNKLKDYDLYFIHIPKNAGTSFILELCENNVSHKTITEYDKKLWDKTVAIVRNPYTRLISLYNYAKLEKSYWHSLDNSTEYGIHVLYNYCNSHTFEEFIVDLCANNKFEDSYNNYYSFEDVVHVAPQHHWILTPEKKIVSKILRFENLNEDIKNILNIDIKLKKINQSTENYDNYYNDKTRKMVYDKYKLDFTLFGPFTI